MKQYIGTKIIEAEPAVRFRGGIYAEQDAQPFKEMQEHPEEVEQGYRVRYADGYVSWSPADMFEGAYRETAGMNFGLAIEAVIKGKKIARADWNGAFVFHRDDMNFRTDADLEDLSELKNGVYVWPILVLYEDGQITVGWVPQSRDLFADDWKIVG